MFTQIRPVTAADVAAFAGWRYEPPFDVYDLTEPVAELTGYFLSPEVGCHAIETAKGLAGYCTFGEDARVPGGDYSAPALDIGGALMPSLTGLGHGRGFVTAILEFAAAAFEPQTVRVSIAAANTPALRVWTANGLTETQRFHTDRPILGTTEFVVLERDLTKD
jgi:GNAT superfamily N-acetyltransferase